METFLMILGFFIGLVLSSWWQSHQDAREAKKYDGRLREWAENYDDTSHLRVK